MQMLMSNQLPATDDSSIEWVNARSGNGVPFRIGRPKSKLEAAAHVPLSLDINWPPQTTRDWNTPTKEFTRQTGIDYYYVINDNGLYFKYRIVIDISKRFKYVFYDQTGDYYSLECHKLGAHYVDYNSEKPTMVKVTVWAEGDFAQ